MKRITVNASKTYDVIIEKGALDKIGEYLKGLGTSGKACIISDSNVAPLYLDRVKSSLEKSGLLVCQYIFPAGEASKTAETYIDILNFLAENHFSRKDTLFALGGGVCGDLTGFS
ncbi:MAG: iron-containing alcohol dehydrogenase, partial [Clostridia bacterium]|nr:iron-containing alcohol dehydrogenase [Clostridia bacterium]